jgi:hypothetical protein
MGGVLVMNPWASMSPRTRGAASAAVAMVALVATLLIGMVIGRSSATVAAVPTAVTPTVVVQEPDASPLPIVGSVMPAEQPLAVFTADEGLANDRGRATGYRVVDTDIDRRALAEVLAETFGVEGRVVAETTGDWRVGSANGPSIVVKGDAEASWLFSDPTIGDLGRVPAREAALETARTLLGELGVDLAGIDWQVDAATPRTTVIAWQTINDRRTQLAWRVSIGRRGAITEVSGFAGTLQQVPGYPVLGAASAVRRASQPGWSVFGPTQVTVDFAAQAEASEPESAFMATSPTFVGRPVAVATVRELVVTEAELGLAEFTQPSGEVLILPAYLLTAEDGSRWSLLAIADAYVSFQPPVVSSSIRSN